jgi:hypothetical protein
MYDDDEYEPDDNGTMPENVARLESAIVGHRIVKVERDVEVPEDVRHRYFRSSLGFRLTLDNGELVYILDTDDCCAYTCLEDVIEHLPTMDHIVTAVRASEDFNTWHIIADFGEVLELEVGWSAGNPFYYGYGFDIRVVPAEEGK